MLKAVVLVLVTLISNPTVPALTFSSSLCAYLLLFPNRTTLSANIRSVISSFEKYYLSVLTGANGAVKYNNNAAAFLLSDSGGIKYDF